MSNKNIARELALTTTENLADEIIFKTANTLLEDTIKSIPFASLITGSIESYTKFRTLKEQKQLLAFIEEAENINVGFIEKFFKDKDNLELSIEILGILDQTYLEKQAKMIGRASVLFKNLSISKQIFDKYTYIITRLNSHLIYLIEEIYTIETNRDDPEFEYDIKNPNMELVNFGFLIVHSIKNRLSAVFLYSQNHICNIYPKIKKINCKLKITANNFHPFLRNADLSTASYVTVLIMSSPHT